VNGPQVLKQLYVATRSSLQPIRVYFKNYDAQQLQQILAGQPSRQTRSELQRDLPVEQTPEAIGRGICGKRIWQSTWRHVRHSAALTKASVQRHFT